MRFGRTHWLILVGLVCFGPSVSSGFAQTRPWDVFQDDVSDSICDVVNAANAELVVLYDTGQLVIVTGADVILQDSLVDLNGDVFFEDEYAGSIGFAEDGDGFRTVWWMTLTGHVVSIDGFTGAPTESDRFPSEFFNVPCDACDFWDDLTVCPVPDNVDDTVPPITINLCGMNTPLSMALTLAGLGFMSLMRHRPV